MRRVRRIIKNLDYELKWGYPELTKRNREQFAEDDRLRAFIGSILKLEGHEKILDVGCGIGTFPKLIIPLIEKGEIIGIDLNPVLIEFGNQHWGKPPNIHLKVGNANQIPYPDQSFNIITSMGLIENVSNADRVLTEMIRICTHPGKIIIVHIDVLNYITIPEAKDYNQIFYDTLKGMRKVGVDVELSRFKAVCKNKHLPVKKFTLMLDSRYKITEELIDFSIKAMETFYKNETLIQQSIEFYYQYLKYVGWTEKEVQQTFSLKICSGYRDYLTTHLGEELYRNTPINVYRIIYPE
ncbi:MAG: class I SAM-dependent methyltransferase [Promethearchaeota archaeon]